MKPLIITAIAALALSCAHFWTKEQPASVPASSPISAPCPSCDGEIAEVLIERDTCQAKLKTVTRTRVERQVETKVVEKQLPPKRCADAGPEILPIDTIPCQKGMTCLDTAGQARLAANLAAYNAWIERVKACERGDQ